MSAARKEDERSLQEQVAAELRGRIERGDLRPGDPIPSEAALIEQHGVSRQTVRAALKELAQEGLLTGGQGRQRTVRIIERIEWHLSTFESINNHKAVACDPASDQWATDVQAQNRVPRQEVEVAIAYPSERVAARLEVATDQPVVERRRVRYVDGTPYQLATSYFPQDLVLGTPLMQPRDVAAPGGVLASIGHVQVRYRDEVDARMPTRDEATRLEMSPGTPVIVHTRTGYDADGRPLRVMITVVPGDRYTLVYESDAS
ncbi:GntR family transcriptional regulator [Microtetraspora fusca]|uniref:GntR family transcriptional regulator n=1 Tax=Microtetraspora fusca TaxID=1997 RepID=A0ABW6VDW3_MICFU